MAQSKHSTNFIILAFPPRTPREESRRVNGTEPYSRVGTPSLSEPPAQPGRLPPPICGPRCVPIRRISQPRGSGYRRLNDKVPPLPARPAGRPAGTRSGFSTLSPRPRKQRGPPRCAEPAQRQQLRREPPGLPAADSGRAPPSAAPCPPPPAPLLPRLLPTRGTR